MFDDATERTTAISVWATSYSAGAALGPSLGGLLLAHFWWGSVFLVGVPLMLLLLALGPGVLPEFRDPRPGRIDVPSVALSLAATLAIVYGLKQTAQDGIAPAPTLAMMIGASLAIAFVRRQSTLREPLIDLRLLRVPTLGASIAVYALGTFVAFGSFLYVTQYMQLVLGLGPLPAGLWTTPFAAAFLAGSIVSPLLARRTRPAYVMAGGFALAAVGFGLLTRLATAPSLGLLVTGFVVYSLGLAPMFTLCNDLIVATSARIASASGGSRDLHALRGRRDQPAVPRRRVRRGGVRPGGHRRAHDAGGRHWRRVSVAVRSHHRRTAGQRAAATVTCW
jgi:DHA2 family multidrug resistance protein-like MFS transporter